MMGGGYPMKNLQTIPVISYPRTRDRNIQKTASIQLVLWCTDSRLHDPTAAWASLFLSPLSFYLHSCLILSLPTQLLSLAVQVARAQSLKGFTSNVLVSESNPSNVG